jgi:DNA polymerase I-like protein with 3'-5' exonuclease and polymerase domains
MINKMLNKDYGRKPIKNTGFGLIYGMGIGKLAAKSEISVEAAKEVKEAYLAIFPGLRDMYKDMKHRSKTNVPIRTWGGREYYCEPPKLIDGRLQTFDYKMINTLVQGSAADCTKESLIMYYRTKPRHHRLLLQVHDQLTASIPRNEIETGMEILRGAMEGVEFDVAMLSEGSISYQNWATLKDYDAHGVRV